MSKADNFFDDLKNNPEEIIKWAEAEIAEYQKLITLIRKELEK